MTKSDRELLDKLCDDITEAQEKIDAMRKREQSKADNIGYSNLGFTGVDDRIRSSVEGLNEAYDKLNGCYHDLQTVISI